MITKIGVNPTLPFSQTKEKMKRPKIEDWVIQAGEETEDMPVGAFLPNAYREAQDNYIDQLEAENRTLEVENKLIDPLRNFIRSKHLSSEWVEFLNDYILNKK